MPVEIRELTISIKLSEDDSNGSAGNAGDSGDAQKNMIETIVEKVLEVIREKNER